MCEWRELGWVSSNLSASVELNLTMYRLCMFTISGPCSDLPPLMNGVITYTDGLADSRPVDSVSTYTCDNGYTITAGESFRVCQNDGTWDGPTPTCQCEFH